MAFHEGATIAAALHAGAIRTLARSRKFHRPRGLSGSFAAGHLACVDGSPHVRLDRMPAASGLQVAMENVWPTASFDAMRLAGWLPRRWLRAGFEHSRLVPSGTALFEPWERLMRFMAGEAEVPPAVGRAIPQGVRIAADVVVVGGGPAGRGHGAGQAGRAAARGEQALAEFDRANPGNRRQDGNDMRHRLDELRANVFVLESMHPSRRR